MAEAYNPEYDPTGLEGAIDTNRMYWLDAPHLPGVSLKPLRTSTESSFFTTMVRIAAGAELPDAVYLGGMDMWVLSGRLTYQQDSEISILEPGVWGFIGANSRVASIKAETDAELLVNFYGAAAFLGDGNSVNSILTSLDVLRLAREHKSPLVPNTLAYCAKDTSNRFEGDGEPMAIASKEAGELFVGGAGEFATPADVRHPHFVDTRAVPWAVDENIPDVGLKILRISEETGFVTMVVRHNGEAPPHRHLAGADFLVLQGAMGYRAGPPEGTGPGIWVYEPPGARHESTQRLGTQDLIYTANLYGPIAFDSGKGTPPVAILSWMEYQQLAEAAGAKLIPSSKSEAATLLAWAPIAKRPA
ncbi:cupin domain-containing protein [Paraurantiacibacter namhicola]|uniref:ChrR Cupin-like domain protein n=1 Tax=Paraurantiacibacter namhicola TaxID=645517 RepID=A0A1C7DAB6_9SPHN|nr:hypothetical protein [Paraurantiacibacter namhicola]ANU08439.1 ChrR Cupin-like domain protein [Paraurantiacibacter namhicola]